jgi:alpha-glucosidase
LRDNPPRTTPFPIPLHADYLAFEPVYSCDRPEVAERLAALREAAGDDAFLVAEAGRPTALLEPYLRHLDAAFAFELLCAPWDPQAIRDVLGRAGGANGSRGSLAWVLSNHDFPRIASRVGREYERLAALLLLTLPGTAFVYYGEEIGLRDGPGVSPPLDRAGRDSIRHPMPWDAALPNAGFSRAAPWLPVSDPADRDVAGAERDRSSLLWMFRTLIALRRKLDGPLDLIESEPGVLAYRRGSYLVALNFGAAERQLPAPGSEVVFATHRRPLEPHAGCILRS